MLEKVLFTDKKFFFLNFGEHILTFQFPDYYSADSPFKLTPSKAGYFLWMQLTLKLESF
jgi:hypothetical protein